MRRTKIVCTMGPNTNSRDLMKKLIETGMDVARFNFSHGDHDEQKMRMDMLKELRKELKTPVAILLDTKGPEIRTGVLKDGKKVNLVTGQTFTLTTVQETGDENHCSVSYTGLTEDIKEGDTILIDDGLIEMTVTDVTDTDIICKVINGGKVSNKKGVNVPNVELSMDYVSPKDYKDIVFAVKEDFDFIAASFVRTAADVKELRDILHEHGGDDIKIIAKIENQEGIDNIDEILTVADGIMVARGDMGVEIPIEEVPIIQKMIIKKAYHAGKVVVTATQMLDSMMSHPRPTRAEATDVANAIYDGTSAIMLSGETAAGLYPVQALQMMVRIANRTESDIDYRKRFFQRSRKADPDVTDAICHATCTTAHDINAKAIITVTKSGRSARMISKYRPACDIIGCAITDKVYRQLNLSWGVTPVLLQEKKDVFELFEHGTCVSRRMGLVDSGDTVVCTSGVPVGISGTTNMIKVQTVI